MPVMQQLDRAECMELLAGNRFGRLAVTGGAAAPSIRPVNYAFDEASQSLVFRTTEGSKLQALLNSSRAAFEIDEVDPATGTGWSVIVLGVTEVISNPTERRRLEKLGLESWAPGSKPHWVRIRAWTVSGRRIVQAK
ncbi:MAG TPA: pyridoxamine 5'-phosphate oxidase family protein [Solirubrobacteraceae bacterium]|nr:pyridoxamine 5'-phosphate oxidase family protein [Solirubrobacteraceae bacterium]